MRSFITLALVTSVAAIVLPRGDDDWHYDEKKKEFDHVAIFSVDGLHASDVEKYVARGPSNFSTLLHHAYHYTKAYTTFPSDSFPGSLAQFTGANPRTTGVWYDDVWDRSFYDPNSGCPAPPGSEVIYDETKDFNLTLLFSGGIDPKNLPEAKTGKNGACEPVFPHQRSRVNNAWEVVAAAGKKTAYADKHPAYDLMRGPSGTGLSTGYFPEINSAVGYTGNVAKCVQFDQLHLTAFLDWLDGKVPANSEGGLDGKVPTLFGGNFQSVSVGQKTKGYVAGSLDFSPDLLTALNWVDAALGQVINKLKEKDLYKSTLIVVASKHGQSAIDPTAFKKVDPAVFTAKLAVETGHITFDDVALIFLTHPTDLATAVANLNANKATLRIQDIYSGAALLAAGFGDPSKDPAVPDIIVQPIPGTIYTTSSKKIAEHGGGSEDDRHVAVFAHNPKLKQRVFGNRVETTQIAPTILRVLGFNPRTLEGVKKEGTAVLGGFEEGSEV